MNYFIRVRPATDAQIHDMVVHLKKIQIGMTEIKICM